MVRNPFRNAEFWFEFLVGLTCLIASLYVAFMLVGAWFWIAPLVTTPWIAKAIIALLGFLNLVALAASLDFLNDAMRTMRRIDRW